MTVQVYFRRASIQRYTTETDTPTVPGTHPVERVRKENENQFEMGGICKLKGSEKKMKITVWNGGICKMQNLI